MQEQFIHSTAEVSILATLGQGTKVWQFTHIRENASIGTQVNIGRNVYIGPGVKVGSYSKIQNNALLYEPAILEEGVFVGPNVVLTNDFYPRSINPNGSIKTTEDWQAVGVVIRKGASIGAGSICVGPVEIGEWALVGAGSVVVKDVAPFSLVVGRPAIHMKWVGKSGHPLTQIDFETFKCPVSNDIYKIQGNNQIVEIGP